MFNTAIAVSSPEYITAQILFDSMRNQHVVECKHIQFRITGMSAEDGSGKSWIIDGYFKVYAWGEWRKLNVYWHESKTFSLKNAKYA
jgi:hypothetical protein